MSNCNSCFNPYYNWLIIFTLSLIDKDKFRVYCGFNPYYNWLIIFTTKKETSKINKVLFKFQSLL